MVITVITVSRELAVTFRGGEAAAAEWAEPVGVRYLSAGVKDHVKGALAAAAVIVITATQLNEAFGDFVLLSTVVAYAGAIVSGGSHPGVRARHQKVGWAADELAIASRSPVQAKRHVLLLLPAARRLCVCFCTSQQRDISRIV
jgi:hypothetical protein